MNIDYQYSWVSVHRDVDRFVSFLIMHRDLNCFANFPENDHHQIHDVGYD